MCVCEPRESNARNNTNAHIQISTHTHTHRRPHAYTTKAKVEKVTKVKRSPNLGSRAAASAPTSSSASLLASLLLPFSPCVKVKVNFVR